MGSASLSCSKGGIALSPPAFLLESLYWLLKHNWLETAVISGDLQRKSPGLTQSYKMNHVLSVPGRSDT